jgi:hypothetical protein
MGFSKNSENQTGKGGLLRLRGWIGRDCTGARTGNPDLIKGMKMARTATRIKKSRGGKRRARKKRSGKTARMSGACDPRKLKFSGCSVIGSLSF